nr:hypothetical protein [Acinetobacter sp. HY1485]
MSRNKGALEKHIYPVFGKRLFASIRPIEWMEHLKGIQQQQYRMRSMCRDIITPLEGLYKSYIK